MFKVGDKVKIKDSVINSEDMNRETWNMLRTVTHIGNMDTPNDDFYYIDFNNEIGTCYTQCIYNNDLTRVFEMFEKVED